GFAVEAAHVALRIVEAHEPVHLRHGGEGVVDRFLQLAASGTGRGDLDESAQQRLLAANASGDVHTRPKFASRLRSRASRTACRGKFGGCRPRLAAGWRWFSRKTAPASSGF